MRGLDQWLALGWRHPVWDLHRFYLSLAKKKSFQKKWLEELRENLKIDLLDGSELPISRDVVELFFKYIQAREEQFVEAEMNLRSEEDALNYCERLGVTVGRTATKSADHHQSSKAMIAAVSALARDVCAQRAVTVETDPQARCVWCAENELHVSARNLDGAIPGLANPKVVWEIKEYWGKTSGGSKMSDAVYECHLVGLELKEFEERTGCKVSHVVFVDGRTQWSARRSDLRRFIDLLNQGLIDHLIVGKEVEASWKSLLDHLLSASSK